MDRRQCLRRACHGRRVGRRRDRDLRRHAGRWARASPPATRSWRSTCSACRSRRSASCMGDTDRGTGFGSAGSRSLFTAGSAVKVASEQDGGQGARTWPARRWRPPTADIEYCRRRVPASPAPTARIGLFELAAKQPSGASTSTRTSAVHGPSWPNGCHICEVEIDPDTGDGRGRLLRVGQRCRPRGEPDDRERPARRRRGAGPRPGAVRADGLRPANRASR